MVARNRGVQGGVVGTKRQERLTSPHFFQVQQQHDSSSCRGKDEGEDGWVFCRYEEPEHWLQQTEHPELIAPLFWNPMLFDLDVEYALQS